MLTHDTTLFIQMTERSEAGNNNSPVCNAFLLVQIIDDIVNSYYFRKRVAMRPGPHELV